MCQCLHSKRGQIFGHAKVSKKNWLPNIIHPIGGKVDLNENPFIAAQREVLEETGVKVKNMKLEAVILEIAPVINDDTNWLIFHFTADYESGEVIKTEEGELEWHTAEEIKSENLFPSVREAIEYIFNPDSGTVFLTVKYDKIKEKIVEKSINTCNI